MFLKKLFIVFILFATLINAKVYEDAESQNTSKWALYSGASNTATIKNIYDTQKHSNVIKITANKLKDGYALGGGISAWHDKTRRNISWDMKYSNEYHIYVSVQTKKGHRYIYYTQHNGNIGRKGQYIHYGLGTSSMDGNWHTISRNLNDDLHAVEADNDIIEVNAFLVRGTGYIDNVVLNNKIKVYEDAESQNTSKWALYSGASNTATIKNIYDTQKHSNVIKITANKLKDGYALGGGISAWHDKTRRNISWDMKYSNEYHIYVSVQTKKGHRYIYYTQHNGNIGRKGQYIHYGLGTSSMDGNWHTISRNLNDDLHAVEADNDIIEVNAFLVRGTGYIDNIILSNMVSPTIKIRIKGYPESYSMNSTDSLKLYLSAPSDMEVNRIKIVDNVSGRTVINQQIPTQTILASECKSFKGDGCNFPSTIILDDYHLVPSIYSIYIQSNKFNNTFPIYINIKPIDSIDSDIAVIQPSMTWEAYNKQAGYSLYNQENDALNYVSKLRTQNPDHYLSYLPAIRYFKFLKKHHYKVGFYDDYDLHHDASFLNEKKLVIIILHSEYWTSEMRDSMENYVRNGGNLLILSGNTMWWKVNLEDNDIIVDRASSIGLWRKQGQPEEAFIGLTFQGAGYPVKRKIPSYEEILNLEKMTETEYNNSDGMYVMNAHAIFRDTNLKKNDLFGKFEKIVDVEMDGIFLSDTLDINFTRFPTIDSEIKGIAYGWAIRSKGKGITYKSMMIAESTFGKGKVLNMGSIGWYHAVEEKNRNTLSAKILKNSIDYMLGKLQ